MIYWLENYALKHTQKWNGTFTLFILHAEKKGIFVLISPLHWQEHHKLRREVVWAPYYIIFTLRKA